MATEIELNTGGVPQSTLLRRRLAEAMMKQAQESGPVQHPLQAWARAMSGYMGGLEAKRLEDKETGRANALTSYEAGKPSLSTGGVLPAPSAPATSSGDTSLPRSVRLNNAGAIEDGAFAKSQPGYAGGDGRYAKFDTPESGYKAMEALLGGKGYMGGGNNTVAGIVGRWAPVNVDQNSTPQYIDSVAKKLGVAPDQPLTSQHIPQLAGAMAEYEAGNGRAAKRTAQAAPPPGSSLSSTGQPPQASSAPQAAPTPQSPVVPTPAGVQAPSEEEIKQTALQSPDARYAFGIMNDPSKSLEARQQARNDWNAAIERTRAAGVPNSITGQAELAYKQSQTRENEAQLPKHAADARKADMEARKAELENMRLKTPADSYGIVQNELNKLAAMEQKYGTTALERGMGEHQGRVVDEAARSDPIGYAQEKIANVGGWLSSYFEGGAPASKIKDEIQGAQATISQTLRGLTGMSARQGDSNMELQNILTMTGNLTKSTGAPDLKDRIAQINDRIAAFTGQKPGEITPKLVGEQFEPAKPLQDQAAAAASGLAERYMPGGLQEKTNDAMAEKARIVEELRKRANTPEGAAALLRAIQGGM